MGPELDLLKKTLIEKSLISEREFEKAKKDSERLGMPFEQFLVDKKLISDENLAKVKAEIFNIPFVNLEKEIIPSRILKNIPEPLARRHNIVAFKNLISLKKLKK